MIKTKSKMSLAEQIAALNDPAPSYDPEDASDTETTAKLAEFEDEFEDVPDARPSQLRRRAVGVLAEEDKRYAGRTTSRKTLDLWEDDAVLSSENDSHATDSDTVDSGEDPAYPDSEGDVPDGDKSGVSDAKLSTRSIKDAFERIRRELDEESSSSSSSDDDDDDDDDSKDDNDNEDLDRDDIDDDDFDDDVEDDDAGDDTEDEDEDYPSDEEAESGVQAFSSVSIEEEVAKGRATKTQLTLWDAFIENRIKLQKALAVANQLPAYDEQPAFVQTGGQAVQEMLHSSSRQLRKLLRKLVDLQQALLLGNQATRHIVEGKEARTKRNSDEEITSSDDDGGASSPAGRAPKMPPGPRRKRKWDVGDLGEFLAKRHRDLETFQYDTIQKWHDKTRLAAGKSSAKSFASFEKSAVAQIRQVLQDKPRLIKRTQLRRTPYRRLGEAEGTNDDDATNSARDTRDKTVSGSAHLKDFDEETFDDDDFYHQLLRELIEKRTSSTTDPVQLTRQWLEVQKLRRKIKKKVDTRASKGRKMRYDVHPQLVSFMAGRDAGTMMESAQNELFSSLFGKRPTSSQDAH